MRMPRLFTVCASIVVLAVAVLGQLTVDVTGPIRQRKREAMRGHGGGVGRKLPLKVTIVTTGAPPDHNGKTPVEFVLTNSGKNDLTLPISPHPGDLEPSDPEATYTVMTLGLRISLSEKPGIIFPGGAELYGSAEFPESLVSLAPGDSIRVLTLVALPEAGGEAPNAEGIDASASLSNQTIRTLNGQLVSDSQEIGFARSQEYTIDSLLRPRD
jgi:hypothetical protein